MEKYIPQNPGMLPDPPDERDYIAEKIMSAVPLPEEYEVLAGFPLKIENQGSSGSCVAQSFSKYAEVLEIIENKRFMDLSARFIYSQIYVEPQGAYIRDGAKLVTEQGVASEKKVPSYMLMNFSPTEEFMRDKSFLMDIQIVQEAAVYGAKSYARIESKSFETIKQAIYQNHGCVIGLIGSNEGWKEPLAIVRPPKDDETQWGHAVYLRGWKKIDNKQYLIIHNSWSEYWGDKGRGYVGMDYFNEPQFIYNPWTLIDKENIIKQENMKWVILENNQYLIDEKLKVAISIADEEELKKLQEKGLSGEPESVSTLKDYLIYPGIETSRLKDIFNL